MCRHNEIYTIFFSIVTTVHQPTLRMRLATSFYCLNMRRKGKMEEKKRRDEKKEMSKEVEKIKIKHKNLLIEWVDSNMNGSRWPPTTTTTLIKYLNVVTQFM